MSAEKYNIRESRGYFGRLDGELSSPFFGGRVPFSTKGCGEVYAVRCAEYFEKLTLDDEAFFDVMSAISDYISDLLAEHEGEFDLGDADYNEILPESVPEVAAPVLIMFERSDLLTDEDCPIAFCVKFGLRGVADEFFEIAMREDKAVYAGEYRGVSPWNDGLLKKKWNYVRN